MKKRHFVMAIALLVAAPLAAWYWRDTSKSEVEKLTTMLEWKPGRTVAEIGAGQGKMIIAAADRVGPSGHVFSTELDSKRLADIRAIVGKRKLASVQSSKPAKPTPIFRSNVAMRFSCATCTITSPIPPKSARVCSVR